MSSNDTSPPSPEHGTVPVSGTRKCIVVLGMHRSGTSALTGLLSILGCDTPASPMPATDDNAKGYFESNEIYGLHHDLLSAAGSRWDDWLPVSPQWFGSSSAETFRDRAGDVLTREFGASRLFVLKDPRICRLLPFWEAVLAQHDVEPHFILPLRNPLEVAASLQRRNNFDRHLGLLMWLRHVLEAEASSRGKSRCFTSYSELLNNWGHVVEKIQSELDLTLPRMSLNVVGEVEEFLSAPLRNFSEDPASLLKNPLIAEWVRTTYDILDRWDRDGENPDDYAQLDAIRASFDATGPLFFGIVQAGRDSDAKLVSLGKDHAKVQSELTALNANLDALRAEKEAAQRAVESRSSELEQARSNLQQRDQELEQSRSALAQHKHELDQARSALEQRKNELDQSRSEGEQARNSLQQRDQELAQSRSALEESQGELLHRVHEVEQSRSELEQRKHELDQTRSELEQRRHELDQTRSELERSESASLELRRKADQDLEAAHGALEQLRAEQTREAGRLDRERSEMAVRLETLQARLEEMRAQSERDRQALSGKDADIEGLEGKLDTLSHEVAKMTGLLATSEDALEQHQKASAEELSRESAARSQAESRLAEAEQRHGEESARTNAALTQQEKKIQALDSQFKNQSRELSQLTRLLMDSERALKQAEARTKGVRKESALALKAAAERAERAEYAVMAVQSSTTWKLMAPFRALSSALRRRG